LNINAIRLHYLELKMKKNDLIEAADRALSLLAEMSDDELILTLEQCDASLAYAVNYHTS